jgi:hypothetical protein
MIKEDKVLIPINLRNRSHFMELGYNANVSELLVEISDLLKGSKVKVTAICEICKSENKIQYNKYLVNYNRNNKGFYSCFSCKNIEKEKTCIQKWGVKSYSMTEEFKKSESEKWKGTMKGHEKGKKTMLERYGVDSYSKIQEMRDLNRKWMSSNEFKEKSKLKIQEKWGVDSYSKTNEFKEKISLKKDNILEKIKNRFLEIYGFEYYSQTEEFKIKMSLKKDEIISKIKKTCLDRYGVDNVSKVEKIQKLIISTKKEKDQIIPDCLITEWVLYKRDVRRLTNKVKMNLYENWNGYDYYDNEFIKGYLSLSHVHRFYPTIDHKLSTYFGFINGIDASEISKLDNLCITKRYINSEKNKKIESEFKINTSF